MHTLLRSKAGLMLSLSSDLSVALFINMTARGIRELPGNSTLSFPPLAGKPGTVTNDYSS